MPKAERELKINPRSVLRFQLHVYWLIHIINSNGPVTSYWGVRIRALFSTALVRRKPPTRFFVFHFLSCSRNKLVRKISKINLWKFTNSLKDIWFLFTYLFRHKTIKVPCLPPAASSTRRTRDPVCVCLSDPHTAFKGQDDSCGHQAPPPCVCAKMTAVGTTPHHHASALISRWCLLNTLTLPWSTPCAGPAGSGETRDSGRKFTNRLLHWTWLLKNIATNTSRKDNSRQKAKLKCWVQHRCWGYPYPCVSCKEAFPLCWKHSHLPWQPMAYPHRTCTVHILYCSEINQRQVK